MSEQLTLAQVRYIEVCINSYHHSPLSLYYNLPSREQNRLREELRYSPIGTILEAYSSIADAMSNRRRRFFWKKTENGIFQIITNEDVDLLESIVLNP